jgi:flavin-dependent dehydrogenase
MAAVRLARAGRDVTLFDASHPREKPCGGGLTGRALRLLDKTLDIGALPSVVVTSASVESPAGDARTASVPLNDRGISADSSLVVLSRAVFDKALLDAAIRSGARLIAEKVIDLSCGSGRHVHLRTQHGDYDADFVLGADGANSLVRKTVMRPFARSELSVASGFYVRGATSTAIDIKPIAEQPGYLWSFPRPDHLAVGICAPAVHRTSSGELQRQTRVWLRAHALDRDVALEPYAWPIPGIGNTGRRLRVAGANWMLLGDAAGLVDPLTREGIYYALLSAHFAADALISRSHAPGHAYETSLDHEVRPELERAAKLCGLFFTPAFADLLVEGLNGSQAVRQVFVDLVGGTQPYRGLRRRLLATRQWRLAGRAIRVALGPRFTGTMRDAILPRHSSTA